ncbi:MAG: dihydrofolate reductase [Patescibacteria group bacterium]|nr:dihydrofolate reductase [Patescibacteria group bacterium]
MLSIIAALDEKRGLGKDNKLLWHIPEDLQRFKRLTKGHPVIMGRKTWESLPVKPLPNRYNIIITQNSKFKIQNYNSKLKTTKVSIANSIEQAIGLAKQGKDDEEIFIIGGGQIYKQAIEKGLADRLYLTIVKGDFGADTFFPEYSGFKRITFKKEGRYKEYVYNFLNLKKQ